MKLELLHLYFGYNDMYGNNSTILSDIGMNINSAEFIALVGPSGSGKTTLVQQFTGLLRPSSGKVLVDDIDIWSKGYDKNRLRKRIGLVFQFPETQLFEETVFKDIAYGPNNQNLDSEKVKSRVNHAMDVVGLDTTTFGTRSPFRLSEGEKRRVAIAGVLAMDPEMIVLDEPTAGLDPNGVRKIENILLHLNKIGRTVFIVTHNMDFVLKCAERVLVLSEGMITYDGPSWRLFCHEDLLRNADLELPNLVMAWEKQRNSNKNITETEMQKLIKIVREHF